MVFSKVGPNQSIERGQVRVSKSVLCMNVCFKDKTLFSFRFACDMFIVGADLSDWKTGNYDIIHEYMKPIPR